MVKKLLDDVIPVIFLLIVIAVIGILAPWVLAWIVVLVIESLQWLWNLLPWPNEFFEGWR